MATVSVLMTAFNAGSFLAESVKSVLEQTFSDFDFIIVDNGSTDGSFNQIDTSDPRLRVVKTPQNIGRTPALALALDLAASEFVAILDADDVANPERLMTQVTYMREHPSVGLIGTAVTYIDSDSTEITGPTCFTGEVSHDVIGERNVFLNSSVMFRRDLSLEAGGYDAKFEYAQDYDLILRIMTASKAVILEPKLTNIRCTRVSYTRSPGMKLIRARDEHELFRLAPERLHLTRSGLRLNRRRQAISTVYLGLIEIINGRVLQGVGTVMRGVVTDNSFSWIPYLVQKFLREIMYRARKSILD